MRVLTMMLTAAAVAVAASAGPGVPDASAAFVAPARSAARATSEHETRPSCTVVTAAEIKTILGLSVGKPTVTGGGSTTLCSFTDPKYRDLLVRVETGMSRSNFQAARKEFDSTGQPTKDFPGLGVPAYSSVLGSKYVKVNTLALLKGSTEVLLTGAFPLGKLAALAKKVLPEI